MKPGKLLCYMYDFVSIFGLDRAQTRRPQYILKALEQLTNRNVPGKIFNCSLNIKTTKDCAVLRPFQHKLQRDCFRGKVS